MINELAIATLWEDILTTEQRDGILNYIFLNYQPSDVFYNLKEDDIDEDENIDYSKLFFGEVWQGEYNTDYEKDKFNLNDDWEKQMDLIEAVFGHQFKWKKIWKKFDEICDKYNYPSWSEQLPILDELMANNRTGAFSDTKFKRA